MSIESFPNLDVLEIMHKALTSLEDSVIACWWGDTKIHCEDVLSNLFSDLGTCYAFNLKKKIGGFATDEKLVSTLNFNMFPCRISSQFVSNMLVV